MSRFADPRLGRGSDGGVYWFATSAWALPLALKVLHPQLASASRAARARSSSRRARLAARLTPSVVAIYG